jgi:transposase
VTVALARASGDLARVSRLGRARFDAAVRRQIARWDAVNPWRKIIDGVFAACADPAGVTELRHGALERAGMLLADWRGTQARLAGTERRMAAVLGELGLTELVTSITGLSAVGAATILAETGTRGDSPPAAPWSSTPGWRRGRRAPAATPAAPA